MTRKSNKPEEILRSGKSGNDERSISRAKKQIENEPVPLALEEMITHLELARKAARVVASELINQESHNQLDFIDLPIQYKDQCLSQMRFIIRKRLENFFLSLNNEFCLVKRIPYVSDLVFFSRSLRCLLVVDTFITKFEKTQISKTIEMVNTCRDEFTKVGENPPIGLLISISEEQRMARYILETLPTKMFEKEYLSVFPPIGYIEEELDRWIDELKSPVWRRWKMHNPKRMVDLDYEILMEGFRRVFQYQLTGEKSIYF